MSGNSFITIDIGKAWTKAFLASLTAENVLEVERSARLPTSKNDISFTVKNLISNFSDIKETPRVFVSRLPGVKELAKRFGGSFVNEKDATRYLLAYLKKADSNVEILDAGASNFETRIDTPEIGKFLSFTINEITLENFLGNKVFRPHTLPISVKELEIEEAFFRNLFGKQIEESTGKNKLFIAATGGIVSGTPSVYRLASLFLDIIPAGQVAQVYFDREFFLPSFGALLAIYKQLYIADTGSWFDNLGVFVSLGSEVPVSLDWGYSAQQRIELTEDEIAMVPTPAGQDITVEFTIGKEKRKSHVRGGSLGILIDARVKPLPLIFNQKNSREKVVFWLKQLEESRMAEEAF